jgi:phosphoribosyl 1,2-cyclic phosphodiesterase
MKLTFLGTRALTEKGSPHHHFNSALLIREGKTNLLVDCGSDWCGSIQELRPQAIILTHAHPDHADGLKDGAPCPVYATQETWERLEAYPVGEKYLILPETPIHIGELTVAAIPLHHSERAPSVGFRLSSARISVFYSSDVALLPEPSRTLRHVHLYVGDGSSYRLSLLRKGEDGPLGHASMETQLQWCAAAKVPRVVFTHCGEELISPRGRNIEKEIQMLGEKLGVETLIAWDGMEINLV